MSKRYYGSHIPSNCGRILAVLFLLMVSNVSKAQETTPLMSYSTYSDIEKSVYMFSYLYWPHNVSKECVETLPYIRYAPAIPVQPCDEITDKAVGCYDIETDHPRITIWIGAVASCELHVRLLLHEFMHHWLYCHLDITNHPDVYFGKLLDYQTKNAVKAICVP